MATGGELAFPTFISYAHNPTTRQIREEEAELLVARHRSNVLSLSKVLRRAGVDTFLDQYVEDDPPDSWPMWMEEHIKQCRWVLMICSESYHKHITGRSAEGGCEDGRGSRFEGKIIYSLLTDESQANKFIPVFLGEKNTSWLPASLKGSNWYHLQLPLPDNPLDNREFQKLYARLTGQNRTAPPPVGPVVCLPSGQPVPRVTATAGRPTTVTGLGLTAGQRHLDHPTDEKRFQSVFTTASVAEYAVYDEQVGCRLVGSPGLVPSTMNGTAVTTRPSRPFNPALHGKLLQKDLVKLSTHLGYHWKQLAFELSCRQADIDNFEYGAQHSLKEQAFQMLLSWTRKCGRKATWEALGLALTAIGQQEISYDLDL